MFTKLTICGRWPETIYKLAQIRMADQTINEYSRDLQHFLDWTRRKDLNPT